MNFKENIDFNLLREEIIGKDLFYNTPYGKRLITYADYTASGRTLNFMEKYLINIQKTYANTHTDDDMTGSITTKMLHRAESIIKEKFNATNNCYIIPSGTGATGAILNLCKILGLYMPPATKINILKLISSYAKSNYDYDINYNEFVEKIKDDLPVVFISPYEHHSNILLWRESFAQVVEIKLNSEGTLDLQDLEEKLSDDKYKNRKKIGSFSAASNVTGVLTPVYEVAKLLHKYDALACFDFAASGPYVEIDMNKGDMSYFDAIYLSPHKFIGGPGSSGILVINKNVYYNNIAPTVSGGGTVDYVSSFGHDYVNSVEEREKAGTPGILQIIKAALTIELKDEIGIKNIENKEKYYTKKALERFIDNSNIEVLGPNDSDKRISIVSFMIKHKDKYLHPRFVARLLNDLFGIQSRAGCACAGPYGHKLLNIDEETSNKYRNIIKEGITSLKPGWTRINLHYVMTEEEVDFICDAVEFVSNYGYLFLVNYMIDAKSGLWTHKDYKENNNLVEQFGIKQSLEFTIDKEERIVKTIDKKEEYSKYLDEAYKKVDELKLIFKDDFKSLMNLEQEELNWFYFLNSKE